MLLTLAAIAVATTQSPRVETAVRANARVSVRIISGARIELGRSAGTPDQPVRQSLIRLDDGSRQIAQLIEFN
jgi:hypothetical protein